MQLIDGTITEITEDDLKDVTAIRNDAFSSCGKLTELVIPDTVTSLGSNFVSNCSNLTKIKLPSGIKTIYSIGVNLNKLNQIIIPEGPEEIGAYCLRNTAITDLYIPDSVKSIGSNAFGDNSQLKNASLPGGLTSLGKGIFDDSSNKYYRDNVYFRGTLVQWCNLGISSNSNPTHNPFYHAHNGYIDNQSVLDLDTIEIPEGAKKIGAASFADFVNLKNVIIPDRINLIEKQAFSGCSQLESINLPSGIDRIAENTFAACTNLKSIIIPEGVKQISSDAFFNCLSLDKLTIPSTVTYIDVRSLRIGSTTNKATITMLPTTPPTISTNTFDTTKLEKIIVPIGTSETYKAATNWSALADYIEEATE